MYKTNCLLNNSIFTYRITRIIACSNNLTTIPLGFFFNEHLVILDVSKNKIKTLPSCGTTNKKADSLNENIWNCPNLKILKLSKNMLKSLPDDIQGAKGLEKLFLDDNHLSSFEIIWNCPLVCFEFLIRKIKMRLCHFWSVYSWAILSSLHVLQPPVAMSFYRITHLQMRNYIDVVSITILIRLPLRFIIILQIDSVKFSIMGSCLCRVVDSLWHYNQKDFWICSIFYIK